MKFDGMRCTSDLFLDNVDYFATGTFHLSSAHGIGKNYLIHFRPFEIGTRSLTVNRHSPNVNAPQQNGAFSNGSQPVRNCFCNARNYRDHSPRRYQGWVLGMRHFSPRYRRNLAKKPADQTVQRITNCSVNHPRRMGFHLSPALRAVYRAFRMYVRKREIRI